MRICKYKENTVLIAYKASCLGTDGGESMDGLDYGTKGVDQFAMLVLIEVDVDSLSRSSWRMSSREEEFWSFSAEGCFVRSTLVCWR